MALQWQANTVIPSSVSWFNPFHLSYYFLASSRLFYSLQALVDDANVCRRKMNNATTLIDGLSGERVRWTEASKDFEARIGRLVGDVLLATGFLSYAGPFNQEFRTQILQNWKREMTRRSIPFTNVSEFSTSLNICLFNVWLRHHPWIELFTYIGYKNNDPQIVRYVLVHNIFSALTRGCSL